LSLLPRRNQQKATNFSQIEKGNKNKKNFSKIQSDQTQNDVYRFDVINVKTHCMEGILVLLFCDLTGARF
jgi:hypothetical protein